MDWEFDILYEMCIRDSQRIDLHKNFRSRNEVLDFTHDIFYKIMAADLGNVQYDDDAALYPGASYPKETMRPELLLVDYSPLVF